MAHAGPPRPGSGAMKCFANINARCVLSHDEDRRCLPTISVATYFCYLGRCNSIPYHREEFHFCVIYFEFVLFRGAKDDFGCESSLWKFFFNCSAFQEGIDFKFRWI